MLVDLCALYNNRKHLFSILFVTIDSFLALPRHLIEAVTRAELGEGLCPGQSAHYCKPTSAGSKSLIFTTGTSRNSLVRNLYPVRLRTRPLARFEK